MDMTPHEHLLDYDPDRMLQHFATIGEPTFRAKQVLEWIYEKSAPSLDAMTNLSKPLRQKLADRFDLFTSTIIRRAASKDGTVKLLLQWPDGATSECVMIPSEERKTACISSQVGCPVGCRFCASGLDGVQRNLTPGQIIEQVLRVRVEAELAGGRLSNVVFMGLGEPLANYDNVTRAVRTINAPWGCNIGARKITISTVGLPKQIRKLAEEGLQLNLALSLHAPSDTLRAELIPWAEKISLGELTMACRYYFEKTGREITLEYILLHEVNDRQPHAAQLAKFAKNFRCNVNLIRYNPVEGLPYDRPTSEATASFQKYLREHGVNSHVRTSRGLDIDAACGQLRRKEMQAANAPVQITLPPTE
ncbi:MAG: 23S rRNA (adenine(2503)-C(2))-methyltransferase RlmN [Planctomycetota bacterium]